MEDFNILVVNIKRKMDRNTEAQILFACHVYIFFFFKMKIKKNCTFFKYFNVECIEK